MRMITAILLVSVPLAGVAHQAKAQDTTRAAAQIRVESYSPLKRTEIVGVIGQPTTITFPTGKTSIAWCNQASQTRMAHWQMPAGKVPHRRRSRIRLSAIT